MLDVERPSPILPVVVPGTVLSGTRTSKVTSDKDPYSYDVIVSAHRLLLRTTTREVPGAFWKSHLGTAI